MQHNLRANQITVFIEILWTGKATTTVMLAASSRVGQGKAGPKRVRGQKAGRLSKE